MSWHFPKAWDRIWVDTYFCFRPRNHLAVRKCRSRPWRSCPINCCRIRNHRLIVQYQFLRDIEQILKFLKVCVPVYFQFFNVIWSKMSGGFHCCQPVSWSTFLSSLGHDTSAFCLKEKGCRKTSRNSWSSTKRRRWSHSSRVKLPLVDMSASWFLVSTCLIWILGSKLVLSKNQSIATLWILDTCLIVGLLPLMIILITALLSSKMYNWDSLWEEFAFVVT